MSLLRQNSPYIFLLCVFVAFMKAGFYAQHENSQAIHLQSSSPPFSTNQLPFASRQKSSIKGSHPIPRLMDDAEKRYREKLKRQSKSLRDAVFEYKRRYNRDPPKGFDEWWMFAMKYDVKLVDEYDGLMKDLEPFWEISGEELRRRALQVGELPSIDLVRIRDGKASTINMAHGFEDSEVSARAHGFISMIGKFVNRLPDMDFPINAKAEGRVLVPWEHRVRPNMTVEDSSGGIQSVLGGPFRPDWDDDGNVWEAWRRTCDPSSPARQLYSSVRQPFAPQIQQYLQRQNQPSFPFISSSSSSTNNPGDDFQFSTRTSQIDFCHSPHEHYFQGHFFSDWRSIPALYPVFSPAKAKGFLDIRIPSHYYYGSTQRYTYGWDPINLELKSVDPMEVPWEDKIDKVFWRGADTGGGNHPPGFQGWFQRHRFLHFSSSNSSAPRTLTFGVPSNPGTYTSLSFSQRELNEDIMDAAFVKATSPGAYPGGLDALKRNHRFADAVPLGRHWAYKYLVDLDGMGYSGRFMAFLASDSVPVKATVYEEFWEDWVEPWVHFIPLSASYKEIYNIVGYFSGAPLSAARSLNITVSREELRPIEADTRLRRIARAGKEWKKTAGRTALLGWARLWADDRSQMGFFI
ncbi:hypothetical protein BDQ17DRAFT_1388221 [Cyathus striatus]|nr:hypothetical protein BDQ17DRAFT_1388221 [Cyathus striatus]